MDKDVIRSITIVIRYSTMVIAYSKTITKVYYSYSSLRLLITKVKTSLYYIGWF